MKKLLFVLVVVLFSCDDKTYCYECEVITTYKATGYITTTEVNTVIECDISDVAQFEKEKSSLTVIKIGLLTASTEVNYKCKL